MVTPALERVYFIFAREGDMADVKPKQGRPAIYTNELAIEFCARLAEQGSTRAVCKADDMPAKTTIYKWLFERPCFADLYARAKSDALDDMADEALEIADESVNAKDNVGVSAAKLRVDTRKWYLAKCAPRKYGDKIEVDNTSSDGSMTPKPNIIELVAPRID